MNLDYLFIQAAIFETGLHHSPKSPVLYNDLAMVYMIQSETEKAILTYESAFSIHPKHAILYNNYATALAKAAQKPGAKEAFETAILIAPSMLDARVGLAVLLLEMEEYEDAAVQYDKLAEAS